MATNMATNMASSAGVMAVMTDATDASSILIEPVAAKDAFFDFGTKLID